MRPILASSSWFLLAALVLVASRAAEVPGNSRAGAESESVVDFTTQIAPIFEQHCIGCHGAANRKGDISLATDEDLRENEYVVAGEPDSSYLVDLIVAEGDDRPEMPKEGAPLSAEQVALVRRWIVQGAEWPEGVVVRQKAKADSS